MNTERPNGLSATELKGISNEDIAAHLMQAKGSRVTKATAEVSEILGISKAEVRRRAFEGGYKPMRRETSDEECELFRQDVAYLLKRGWTFQGIATECGRSGSTVQQSYTNVLNGTGCVGRKTFAGVRALSLDEHRKERRERLEDVKPQEPVGAQTEIEAPADEVPEGAAGGPEPADTLVAVRHFTNRAVLRLRAAEAKKGTPQVLKYVYANLREQYERLLGELS